MQGRRTGHLYRQPVQYPSGHRRLPALARRRGDRERHHRLDGARSGPAAGRGGPAGPAARQRRRHVCALPRLTLSGPAGRHRGDHVGADAAAAARGSARVPILVINDSPIKQFAENRHAVGQSVLESYIRITNQMTNAAESPFSVTARAGRASRRTSATRTHRSRSSRSTRARDSRPAWTASPCPAATTRCAMPTS